MILKEKSGKVKRLGTIGETRWLSKSMALGKIFGSYDNLDNHMLRDFLIALHTIAQTDSFEKAARKEAKDLLDTFCKFENILTAFVFLRVFRITTPLSLYLQTKGLDMLQALRMVESVESQLQKVSRDFESMHKKATDFCIVLDELLIDTEIEIEKNLPVKRRIQDLVGYFRINTYNVIMD